MYRYGFNGMEKDDEVAGEGNSYDFGARMYDSRLGKWLAIDPLAREYPCLAPYIGMGNNPIFFRDADGRVLVDKNGNIIYEKHESKESVTYKEGGYTITITPVYVFSNSGQRIEVQKYTVLETSTGKKVDNQLVNKTYNCHGYSSLGGKFRVDSSSQTSNRLLNDKAGSEDLGGDLTGMLNDDFSEIKKGDVIVLYNNDGIAVHSYVFSGSDSTDDKVLSKNGEAGINSFPDGVNPNASTDDVFNLYNSIESGGVSKGFFTPVENKVQKFSVARTQGDGTAEQIDFTKEIIEDIKKAYVPESTDPN